MSPNCPVQPDDGVSGSTDPAKKSRTALSCLQVCATSRLISELGFGLGKMPFAPNIPSSLAHHPNTAVPPKC